MATFSNFGNLYNILGGLPGLYFGVINWQWYNGYLYSGTDTPSDTPLLYRFKTTNTSDKTILVDNSFNGLKSVTVDASGVYSYSSVTPSIIYKANLELTTRTTLPLIDTSGNPFTLTCEKMILEGDFCYLFRTVGLDSVIYKINKNTGIVSLYKNVTDIIVDFCIDSGKIYYVAYRTINYNLNSLDTSGNIQTITALSRATSSYTTVMYNKRVYLHYKDMSGNSFLGEYTTQSGIFLLIATPIFNNNNNLSSMAFDSSGTMFARQTNMSDIWTSTNYCFNEGTKILYLNKELFDEYVPIEQLKLGDFVKTYKHGYRKIIKIIKGSFRNNPTNWNMCMYKMTKTKSNRLIEDLIVTGGHSILVDSISKQQQAKYDEMGISEFSKITIDGKHLLLACVSDQFVPMPDNKVYTYYHLLLNNDNDEEERFGIWANGILTETPNEKTIK
jgi:hypothetical protein